jgi:O-antigen/teichoic acid export membrane protein
MPAVACDSRGRPGVTTSFSVASTVLNVGIAVALIPHFGALGAALAVLVNSVVLVPVFLVYVHRRILHSSVVDLVWRSLAPPAGAAAAIAGPAWLLARWAHSLPTLLGALAVTSALYLAATIAFGVFDAADRALLLVRNRRERTSELTRAA